MDDPKDIKQRQQEKKEEELNRLARAITIQKLGDHSFVPTDLWVAAYYGRLDEVKGYLDGSNNSSIIAVDTRQHGYPQQTALHCAAASGEVAMIELLMNYGADVHALDANDNSKWYNR